MKQAVILAAGHTGLEKSFRGSFNQTHGVTMTAHVIEQLVSRSGLAKDAIEDVVIGCGYPFGMIGARLTAAILHEEKRRGAKLGVGTMCIAGGVGAAGLFEIH